MSPPAFRILVVLGCLLGLAPGSARAVSPPDFPPLDPDRPLPQAEHDQRLAAVEPGLTPDQVRRLIGEPRHVCREILDHRYLEQWIYDARFPVRLEFDCPRGQEPRLQSVQPLAAPGA